MSTPTSYAKLTIGAKQAYARRRQVEPTVACALCACAVMPRDMAGHGLRCPAALPEPHPLARWINRIAALNYVTASTLDEWVERGLVRVRTDDGSVRYLERDVSIACSWARALGVL